jgi:tRNA(Ile)-lysidine synthase TilS/MesJ
MKKMPLTIIRPLCLCQEMDIRYYAEARNYQKQVIRCPHENDTNRHAVSDLFNRFEQLNPEARYSIFHALKNSNKLTEY